MSVAREPVATRPAVSRPPRDLRLDFFRGVMQLFIFVAHVPGVITAVLLHRNFGFSDSSELFVLASGYTLGSVFTLKMLRDGYRAAATDLLGRTWRLYRRHLVISVMFMLLVLATSLAVDGRDYVREIRLDALLAQPLEALARLALLDYQPKYLEILPLFVVLTPLILLVLAIPQRFWWVPLALSLCVYAAVQLFEIAPVTWPSGEMWVFDPYSWQLLFVIGVLLGRAGLIGAVRLPRDPALLWGALAFLLFAAVQALPGSLNYFLGFGLPVFLEETLQPLLDKRHLAPLAAIHALVLSFVAIRLFAPQGSFFRGRITGLIAEVGRHSLEVFCLGLFVSFAGHVVLSAIDDSIGTQVVISLVGCIVLISYAKLKGRRRAVAVPLTLETSKA